MLTWSLVGLCRAIVSWLANLATPVCSSAMRSNNIAWCKRVFQCGINVNVVEIQATVGLELDRCHLLDIANNCRGTSNLLLQGHCWPYLMQLNTLSVFHNDVLAADSICRVITPFKNFWYGDPCFGLH